MYVDIVALQELLKNNTSFPKEEISLFLSKISTKYEYIDLRGLSYFIPKVTYVTFFLSASPHYETFVNSGRFSKVLAKWEEFSFEYLKQYVLTAGKTFPTENSETIAKIAADIRESIKTNNSQDYIYLSSLKIQTLIDEVVLHCFADNINIRQRLTISVIRLLDKAFYS